MALHPRALSCVAGETVDFTTFSCGHCSGLFHVVSPTGRKPVVAVLDGQVICPGCVDQYIEADQLALDEVTLAAPIMSAA